MTDAERRLWKAMRWRLPMSDTHFRRQVPHGPYIVDFCCHSAKLIIEVDGGQHYNDAAELRDAKRTADLSSHGFRVLRFTNNDVFKEIESVLDTIAAALVEATPTPDPSPQGGGEDRQRFGP